MKLAISGATGIIGTSLIRLAKQQGWEVVAIVRKNSPRLQNILADTVIWADLQDYQKLEPKINDCDVFVHLAWDKTFGSSRDDVDLQLLNIKYTLDAVRLAHKLGCTVFIGAGSQAEYGPVTAALTADTPIFPQSGYGIAKYSAGKLSQLLCKQLGLRHNWLRILSIYGPNDADYTLISYVINQLKNGQSPQLTKCEQLWDYLYCDDAAEAILAVVQKGQSGKVYPLGSGTPKKLAEYIQIIRDLIDPSLQLSFGARDYYPHQPMFLSADISELTADTGWQPQVTFEQGIRRILES